MNRKPLLCQMNRAALREALSQALAKAMAATSRQEMIAARAEVTRIQRRLAVTTH